MDVVVSCCLSLCQMSENLTLHKLLKKGTFGYFVLGLGNLGFLAKCLMLDLSDCSRLFLLTKLRGLADL